MDKKKVPSHRLTKCILRVVDQEGKPVANTGFLLKQTNHEFLFGCGAFDVVSYATEKSGEQIPFTNSPLENKTFLKDRVHKWLDLYNYGTLPFYWGTFESSEGQPETVSRMNAAKFLQENKVKVKGHPLCWHTQCADWLMAYDNKTILKKQLERIERDVTQFKGVIDMWDVINEVVIMPVFDKYDNAITRICKDLGRVGLVKEVFAAAKEANPDGIFLINDFNLSISYEILIDGCLQAGVPINAIGIQSHQHQGYMGAEKVQEVLKRYEHFGLPIHFTENTLISGDIMPSYIEDLNDWQVDEWPSTPEGEERQMREWEEMYRILYAHPLVEAVTGWDFADGAWLGAPSGVIRKDNSLKPVYGKLKEMIKGEWWTEECEICTDANGCVEIEGVRGDYEVYLGEKCVPFKLTKEMADELVVRV